MTKEQEIAIKKMRDELIEKVLDTQDVLEEYPCDSNGRRDFSAPLVKRPLSREDVTFLVELYIEHRRRGMCHADAARITYACAYMPDGGGTFSPHQRVAELRHSHSD